MMNAYAAGIGRNVRTQAMPKPSAKEIREYFMTNKETQELPKTRFRTGCLLLDLCVGGEKGKLGFPAGSIINIIGDSSAGKSFLKNEIIANGYHTYGKKFHWFSDDAETGDTFDTSYLYGFNITPPNRTIGGKPVEHSSTVEELDAKATLFFSSIPKGHCGVYAVDSLDGLTNNTKIDMQETRAKQLADGKEVVDKGDYGMQTAKFLSSHFFQGQHQAIMYNDALLLIISQTRQRVGAMPFSRQWTVSGGKAMDFYCHTRLFLTTVHKIKKNDRDIGVYVQAETLKSKTPRPFRKVNFTFYFDYGLDDVGSSLDYLYDLRTPRGELQASKCKAIPWESEQEMSMENLRKWLEDNELLEQAQEDCRKDRGSARLTMDWVQDWVKADKDRLVKYTAVFGKEFTRDELIELIDNDPKAYELLNEKVMAKWEADEDLVATNRRSKYAQDRLR